MNISNADVSKAARAGSDAKDDSNLPGEEHNISCKYNSYICKTASREKQPPSRFGLTGVCTDPSNRISGRRRSTTLLSAARHRQVHDP